MNRARDGAKGQGGNLSAGLSPSVFIGLSRGPVSCGDGPACAPRPIAIFRAAVAGTGTGKTLAMPNWNVIIVTTGIARRWFQNGDILPHDTLYNGPHERSVQLKYIFDGNKANFPGFKLTIFQVRGTGVDGTAAAAEHADVNNPIHDLCWENGQPIGGSRFEWSIYPTYVVQTGKYKGAKISFYVYRTHVTKQYPSKSFDDVQFKINLPMRLL